MSVENSSNRPQSLQRLGDVTADATFLVLHAHKNLVIRKASLIAHVAVPAGTQADHIDFKLIDRAEDGTEKDVGAAVTTEEVGVAKGAALALTVPEDFVLETGHSLVLDAAVTGNGAFSPCALSIDVQVQGS